MNIESRYPDHWSEVLKTAWDQYIHQGVASGETFAEYFYNAGLVEGARRKPLGLRIEMMELEGNHIPFLMTSRHSHHQVHGFPLLTETALLLLDGRDLPAPGEGVEI